MYNYAQQKNCNKIFCAKIINVATLPMNKIVICTYIFTILSWDVKLKRNFDTYKCGNSVLKEPVRLIDIFLYKQ